MKIIIFDTLSHMTLTLTSDDLESYIVVNVSSTLTNITIWFVAALCFIVDVCMDDLKCSYISLMFNRLTVNSYCLGTDDCGTSEMFVVLVKA